MLAASAVVLSSYGGNGDATCEAALDKAKSCGATESQIDAEELCLGTDRAWTWLLRREMRQQREAAPTSKLSVYFSGQQMNSLGDLRIEDVQRVARVSTLRLTLGCYGVKSTTRPFPAW